MLTTRSTTIFSCTMLILLTGFLTIGASQLEAQETAQSDPEVATEVWYGELDVKAAVLRLEFHIEKAKDGKVSGKMVSLDQGNVELKLDVVEVTGETITVAIKQAKLEYTGTFDEGKQTATGMFKQLGKEYPFTIKRVETDVELKHTQTWAGRMTAGPQKFDFQFRIFEKDGAAPEVRLDSFTENDFNRLASMEHNGETVTVTIPSTKAMVVGKLNSAADRLDGKWKQRGNEFDIVLRKIALDQTRDPKVNRPQTPRRSFKYKSIDHKIENKADGLTLVGTLTVPNGDGPFPVIVLISGSGPQDRDETIFGHKPFYVIADHVGKQKIATFRFDERGVGESTGSFQTATSEDFARDVELIVEHLKTVDKIDASRIVLMGHSEGGLIAPMIAARRDDISGIVLLAGPGVPGLDIVLNQSKLIATASGASEKDVASNDFLLKELVKGDKSAEELTKIVNEKFKDEMSAEDREKTPLMIAQMKSQFDSPWFKFFITYDPRVDLKKVKIPVLAIVGEKDLQVDPSLNMPEILAALKAAGNQNVETQILPGLNHLFQECETGTPAEYAGIEQTFSPKALEVVTVWLKKHFEMK